MDKNLTSKMDSVFFTRRAHKHYSSLSENLKKMLYSEFLKNPYPKSYDLKTLADDLKLSKEKIRNWFKYQRKKDFKTKKAVITKYKKNHSFAKINREILETYFRKSPELTKDVLLELKKKIDCKEVYIKRWYYYRKRKLQAALGFEKENTTMQIESSLLDPINVKTETETSNDEAKIQESQPKSNPQTQNPESLEVKIPIEQAKVYIPQPTPDLLHARLSNYLHLLANYRAQYESIYQKQMMTQQLFLQNQSLSLNPNVNMLLSLILLGLRPN